MPVEVPQGCPGSALEQPERSLRGLIGVLGCALAGAVKVLQRCLRDAIQVL